MRIAIGLVVLLVTAAAVAREQGEETPKDEVMAAAKALASKGSYTWITTVGSEGGPTGGGAGGGRLRVGPTDGKIVKGIAHMFMQRGDKMYEAAFSGKRFIVKTDRGWRFVPEVAAQRAEPGREVNPVVVIAQTLMTFKAPPGQARELVGKAQELMKSQEMFSGELTEKGARSLLPVFESDAKVSGANGKITFWTKDGVLVKYEYTVRGFVEVNGGSKREIDQTVTTEIKDIGTTKLELAPEAKLKVM
jgi:hypothetical protein